MGRANTVLVLHRMLVATLMEVRKSRNETLSARMTHVHSIEVTAIESTELPQVRAYRLLHSILIPCLASPMLLDHSHQLRLL